MEFNETHWIQIHLLISHSMKLTSEISIWYLIPVWVLSTLLVVYYYRKQAWVETLKKKTKIALIVTRSVVVSLLVLLLFGVLFELLESKQDKPILIEVIDDSSSMLTTGKSKGIPNAITKLQEEIRSKFKDYEIVPLKFSSLTALNDSALSFKGIRTHVSSVFDYIHRTYFNRNIGGVILVSDGNSTDQNNPLYAAEKLKFTPIYCIGSGDTIQKKDQTIQTITTNEIAFLKNKFPVEIDLKGIKMGKTASSISLFHNGKLLSKQAISYRDGSIDFLHCNFLIEATQPGTQEYTLKLNHEKNESNYVNNTKSFYIDIIDSKNTILITSSAPHPDISALSNALSADVNAQVEVALMSKSKKSIAEYDLVICHDPGNIKEINQLISRSSSGKSSFFILGANSNQLLTQRLNLGVQFNSTKIDEVQAALNKSFTAFDLPEIVQNEFSYYPPLSVKFGAKYSNQSLTILANQRIGSISKTEPLIYFLNNGTTKTAVISGEGIWKWRMNCFKRNKSFEAFDGLIQKIVQYTLIKQDRSLFKVSAPQTITVEEDLVLHASLMNKMFERVPDATISLALTSTNGTSKHTFEALDSNYILNLGQLPAGEYMWKAVANSKGSVYSKQGKFLVQAISIEQENAFADHTLLKQLSQQSTGKYATLGNHSGILDHLMKRNDLRPISYNQLVFKDLIDMKWLFLLLVLLLASEWFIRRRNGSY